MASIKNTWANPALGHSVTFEFFPASQFEMLKESDNKTVQSVVGFCFWKDKLLIVKDGLKNTWSPVGGSIESGETFEQAIIREALEEANVKVLRVSPLGYQSVDEGKPLFYQLRYYCLVEPYGDFESDPDGDITEIKWIDPKDYKQYFDWGSVGEYLVEEAVRLHEKHKLN